MGFERVKNSDIRVNQQQTRLVFPNLYACFEWQAVLHWWGIACNSRKTIGVTSLGRDELRVRRV